MPELQSGDRKLSEVARHLILPSGIVSSDFPVLVPQLERMGTPLDRWQQGLGQAILAKRDSGLYACGIGGAVISIPRQVGKTYTIGALIFALCAMRPDLLVLWSAHRADTHGMTFDSMRGLAQRPGVRPYVDRVFSGAGKEAIRFVSGSQIKFGAREHGFGRGVPGVSVVVFDEAQILTERALDDMIPTLNTSENGLVLMMGTPPRPGDRSEAFASRREAALSGDDEDILYVEMSADKGANPNDRRQWAKANPSFPYRTSETAMLRMRKALPSIDSFLREGMGIWDEVALVRRAIDAAVWDSRAVSRELVPQGGRKVFGVKFSVDGSEVALAGALRPDDDGPVHVEAIRQASTSDGTQWLVDFLVERKAEAAQIVVDGKAGAGYLVNALVAGKVPKPAIITPTLDDVKSAHAMTDELIRGGGMSHAGDEALDEQVKGAVRREIGRDGGFGWQAPDGGSVASFDALTLALWGAKTTVRRPGRKAVFV